MRINSEQAKQYAIKLLSDCDIDENLEFNLAKFKHSRSSAQNALYWQILTDLQNTRVNEFAGNTKEYWHLFMKKEYLVSIFEANEEGKHNDYVEMINAIREVWRQGMKQTAEQLFDHIVKQTSTTQATVNEFSKYLECIMSWCNNRGIAYRLPQDIYFEAMGKNIKIISA